MGKALSVLLIFSNTLHFPTVSGNELYSHVYKRHSLLPINEVGTSWFIANTQTGTMAYTYPCKSNCSYSECSDGNVMPCADSRIVSLMLDINVIVYTNGFSSYWIDTKTGCHFLLPSGLPKTDKTGNDVCYDDLRI